MIFSHEDQQTSVAESMQYNINKAQGFQEINWSYSSNLCVIWDMFHEWWVGFKSEDGLPIKYETDIKRCACFNHKIKVEFSFELCLGFTP